MSDWKKSISEKFSPILGIEKTTELVSSIEKVYFIDNNEEAITIIDYLIDVNNGNIQSGINLMNEYEILSNKFWASEKTTIIYSVFNLLSILFVFFYRSDLSNIVFYGLSVLLGIPIVYELFKNIIRGDKKNEKKINKKL